MKEKSCGRDHGIEIVKKCCRGNFGGEVIEKRSWVRIHGESIMENKPGRSKQLVALTEEKS